MTPSLRQGLLVFIVLALVGGVGRAEQGGLLVFKENGVGVVWECRDFGCGLWCHVRFFGRG